MKARLAALTPVLEAQQAAEAALLDGIGLEPCELSFGGRRLPRQLSLHHCGLADGDTLLLESSVEIESESDSDSFDVPWTQVA